MTHEERLNLWYAKFSPLTPWFGPEQEPMRVGVYMVDQSRQGFEQPVFSFWDGAHWYPQDSLPHKVMQWVCYGPIKYPFRKWRGLQEQT